MDWSYGSGFGAKNLNAATPLKIAVNAFKVDTIDASLWPSPTPTSNPDNTNWFNVASGTAFVCTSSYACDDSVRMQKAQRH